MLANPSKKIIVLLQVLLWATIFLIFVIYGGIKWKSFHYAFIVSVIHFSFYAILVYINSLVLVPTLYEKGRKTNYFIAALIFFLLVCAVRLFIENIILFPIQGVFYNYKLPHVSLVVVTNLIAFLFGVLLNIAKNYLSLLKNQEQIKLQQLRSEMDLLKLQLQPHFLYNTLNNIYSLANVKSDNTKIAIAKLAEIMRYFNEDAIKDKVLLSKEVDFIKNYISLEQLRMVYPIIIKIDIGKEDLLIPPMILMPFIENVFKHGIDKTKNDNEIKISLHCNENILTYTVKNKKYDDITDGAGTGLPNLQKRLNLLYNNKYKLHTRINDNYFEAIMEIPI